MSLRLRVSLLTAASLSTLSLPALGHVQFTYPTPRHAGQANQVIKNGPCGVKDDARDPARVTVFEPGETIMITFNEGIAHPGFFRISFDDDGQDAFVPPPTSKAMIQTTPVLPVLVDNIPDNPAKDAVDYTQAVTLPNISCENCTLQLIQVMVTTNTWEADDMYYACADIALRPAASGGAAGMAGMPGSAGAGGSAGSGTSGAGGTFGLGGVGGLLGTGGAAPAAGTGGTSGATGMLTGGTGGTLGSAGGTSSGAGAPGSTTGGTGATGGSVATTGGTGGSAPVSGGAPGNANAGTSSGAGANDIAADPPADEGGCRTVPRSSGTATAMLAFLTLLAVGLRRRARKS